MSNKKKAKANIYYCRKCFYQKYREDNIECVKCIEKARKEINDSKAVRS